MAERQYQRPIHHVNCRPAVSPTKTLPAIPLLQPLTSAGRSVHRAGHETATETNRSSSAADRCAIQVNFPPTAAHNPQLRRWLASSRAIMAGPPGVAPVGWSGICPTGAARRVAVVPWSHPETGGAGDTCK